MGRGAALAGSTILFVSLCLGAGLAAGEDRLLVNESNAQREVPSVVHVVLDPAAEGIAGQVEVVLAIEGPGSSERVRETVRVDASTPRIVSLAWTPERVGPHEIEAQLHADGNVVGLGERTVDVDPAPVAASGDGFLPETAPGTVQWAIAFGILFFVASAGLGRRW